ncbi:MAG: DUF3857 domain-containing protein [Fidelibacterota bacterium]|nr:MAG: DUF3857 domain-containing protein [Candidatus Neomarinimicrobiota bacterium]
MERHRIVKILNTRGQGYANIAIPYTPPNQVIRLQARTISPEGNIAVIAKDDIHDINLYPDFVFYSDQRAKLFTVPAVENGSVVEYRYLVRLRNPTFWHSWTFQTSIPTLLSRFTLIAPSEWKIDYRTYKIDLEAQVFEIPGGTESTYVWEARDIPANKAEFAMPPGREIIAHLALAPPEIESWGDVADWYRRLAEPQIKAGKGVQELASALTSGVENDEEKLRIIYEWVRDKIRYIAVNIGIGGYQPHPAEEVLKNRYGDCKDMTTLLCSLAREAGLEAYEVILSTLQNGIPDTSLPSPYQFNHAIAYCPSIREYGVWMDATEKGCPFGKLPWYDQGVPVLIVAKEGDATIAITPRAVPDSNRVLLDWDIDLQSTGAAAIRGETSLWGAPATELRESLYLGSPQANRQWLETYLAGKCSGAKLDSFRIARLMSVYDPLTISYAFHTATFAIPRAEEMVFRPGTILALDLPDHFRSSNRVHPIRFNFGMRAELNLTVKLPPAHIVNTRNLSDSLVSSFGSASLSCSSSDNVYHTYMDYRLLGEDVPPGRYKGFQDFLDGIRERDMWEVIVSKR